jgi:hypothetical protein
MRGVLALTATLVLLGGAAPIDKEELECEEAVKHLLDCCGDNDGAVRMVRCFVGRACEDQTRPDLSGPQSVCLRDESCAALLASGACGDPVAACR